ncbi:MAG: tetratricopeptide (TPR) repeat protein [Saprospiraceae bacterium]|jgi:tetratricopeptide (TPR) repeat protein
MKRRLILTLSIFIASLVSVAQSADDYFNEVDSILNSNKPAKVFFAQRILNNQLKGETKNARYWEYLTEIHRINKYKSEAFKCIDKAIRLDSTNSAYVFEKARLTNEFSSDTEAALKLVEQAILIKDDPYYRYFKGIFLQMINRNSEAEIEYEIAYNNNITDDGLFFNYAVLLFDANKFQKALEVINKDINLYPQIPARYILQGDIYAGMVDQENCIKSFKIAIEMGYYGEKTATLNKFISLNNYSSLGEYMIFYKKYKPALQYFLKSIELHEDSTGANYVNAGYTYSLLFDYKNTEKMYLVAEKRMLQPSDQLYLNMGVLYEEMKEYQKAKEVTMKQITLYPTANNYVNLGSIYEKLNEHKNALEAYNKALSIHPDFFRAYGYLAQLYTHKEDYNRALEYAVKSLKSKPDYAFGIYQQGCAKLALHLEGGCDDIKTAVSRGNEDANKAYLEFCTGK